MEQNDDRTDAGTFRLIDALFGMDGWRLEPRDSGDGVSLTLSRGTRDGIRIPGFARGRTPGLAPGRAKYPPGVQSQSPLNC